MEVKNNSARLIIINAGKKSYSVVPGVDGSVSICDKAANLEFTKRLIASGELVVTGQAAPINHTEEAAPEAEDDRDSIIEQLTDLGIEFSAGAHTKTLKKLLDEAKDV